MSFIFSWIKKQLEYLKDSFPDIIRGFIFFFLAISGVLCAFILRYAGFNGIIIATASVSVEFIGMMICYFFFKNFIKTGKDTEFSRTDKLKKS